MNVSVILLSDHRSSKTGDLVELRAVEINLPFGFTLSGGTRKFILLGNRHELAVVIGPMLSKEYYYHKDVRESCKDVYGHLEILGGGRVESILRYVDNRTEWSARFFDSSEKFGVYDPIMLGTSVRAKIEKLMGMKTTFEYVG